MQGFALANPFAGDLMTSDLMAHNLMAADRERWLAVLWGQMAQRPGLAAVHEIDLELARVAVAAKEPMLAAIRLAWWREQLAALATGRTAPAQPLLAALAATGPHDWPALAALPDAWADLLEEGPADWAGHAQQRGAALFCALATAAGAPDAGWAAQASAVWAAGQIARGRLGAVPTAAMLAALPDDLPARAPVRALRPLLGLARLGQRDLQDARAGRAPVAMATPRRQLVLARAVLFG
jgi:15-cis-phytoene synthase